MQNLQLLVNICHASELHKPVRRGEKKLLNEMMMHVRFPIKSRVQEPYQKAYLLLQYAVTRFPIRDFYLRVELGETIEQCLRVLAALRDYAVDREKGTLLESTLLFERALKLRAWEDVDDSASLRLCPGLSEDCVRKLSQSLSGLDSVETLTLQMIARTIPCSDPDARLLLEHIRYQHRNRLSLSVTIEANNLCIEARKVHESLPSGQQQSSSTVAAAPRFELVCQHTLTNTLLCYRKVDGAQQGVQKYTVRLPMSDNVRLGDVRAYLISMTHLGLDFLWLGEPHSPQTQVDSANSKNRKKIRKVRHNQAEAVRQGPDNITKEQHDRDGDGDRALTPPPAPPPLNPVTTDFSHYNYTTQRRGSGWLTQDDGDSSAACHSLLLKTSAPHSPDNISEMIHGVEENLFAPNKNDFAMNASSSQYSCEQGTDGKLKLANAQISASDSCSPVLLRSTPNKQTLDKVPASVYKHSGLDKGEEDVDYLYHLLESYVNDDSHFVELNRQFSWLFPVLCERNLTLCDWKS